MCDGGCFLRETNARIVGLAFGKALCFRFLIRKLPSHSSNKLAASGSLTFILSFMLGFTHVAHTHTAVRCSLLSLFVIPHVSSLSLGSYSR